MTKKIFTYRCLFCPDKIEFDAVRESDLVNTMICCPRGHFLKKLDYIKSRGLPFLQ